MKKTFLLLKYRKLLTFMVKNPEEKKISCFSRCFHMKSPSSDIVPDLPGLTDGVNEIGHLLPSVPLHEEGAAQDQLHPPPVLKID